MGRRDGGHEERNRPAVQELGLPAPAAGCADQREVVEGRRELGLFGPERSFLDRERASVERFGFVGFASALGDRREVVERHSHLVVLGAKLVFEHHEGGAQERLGLVNLARTVEDRCQSGAVGGELEIIRRDPLPADLDGAAGERLRAGEVPARVF